MQVETGCGFRLKHLSVNAIELQNDLQEKLKVQEETSADLTQQISDFALAKYKLNESNKSLEVQNKELKTNLEVSQAEMDILKVVC